MTRLQPDHLRIPDKVKSIFKVFQYRTFRRRTESDIFYIIYIVVLEVRLH